jgi:hypothetical protein
VLAVAFLADDADGYQWCLGAVGHLPRTQSAMWRRSGMTRLTGMPSCGPRSFIGRAFRPYSLCAFRSIVTRNNFLGSAGGVMKSATGFSGLTGPERKLIKAAEQDCEAMLRTSNGQRSVIRAEVLRALCANARPDWKVKGRILLTGGRVKGNLDLSGAHLTHPLRFTDCEFEDRVDLSRARSEHFAEWVGGSTRSILADKFESGANLVLQGVSVIGVISLHWANVRGDLRLTNSHLMPPEGQAVAARDARVGGTLFMDGPDFHAEGEVCLRSAHVEGDINCRHARFDNPSGRSIDGDHLIVDGEILLQGYHDDNLISSHYGKKEDFHSDGEVSLQWAQVHRLRATGGRFASPSGYALHADAMHAEDGVYLDRGFQATSEVRLVGAHIKGELCCTKGTFSNPSGLALNAERIEADDVYLDRGFSARGQVRFTDAQVKRQLNATGGDFHNERAGEYALDADGLVCGGEVYLNEGFHAVGAVSLTGAAITGQLNCTDGSFDNREGFALFADGLTTPGMVYLDKGFQAIGEVRFARATVGRQLVCTDGTFDREHGIALDLTGVVCPGDVLLNSTGSEGRNFRATGKILIRDARIARDLNVTNAGLHGAEGFDARGMRVGGSLTWTLDPPPEGPTNLSRAQISRLDDTAESWPKERYTLTGMTYQTVSDHLTLEQRKTWLRQTDAYSSDTYSQLAKVYRQAGREADAQKILIASQRDLRDKKRGHLPPRSRAWSWFIDRFVGYGYKLHRPFVILLIAGLAGAVIFWAAQHAHPSLMIASGTGRVPPFYPVPYSFQLLVPGLDLRETSNWLPDASRNGWGLALMVLTWLMIILGWVLATAVVAGVTRLFRQR